jgi:hypothetical protein
MVSFLKTHNRWKGACLSFPVVRGDPVALPGQGGNLSQQDVLPDPPCAMSPWLDLTFDMGVQEEIRGSLYLASGRMSSPAGDSHPQGRLGAAKRLPSACQVLGSIPPPYILKTAAPICMGGRWGSQGCGVDAARWMPC